MKSKCCDSGTHWIELHKGHILECAKIATWLAIEMAGQHLQLKMDHPIGSDEWALYYQDLPIISGEREDPKKKKILQLVKYYLRDNE